MSASAKKIRFSAGEKTGEVSGLLLRPEKFNSMLVLAHGAGAGMYHKFMDSTSANLADLGVATLRYQFPYMERGGKRPDSAPILLATVRAAVEAGKKYAGDLPLFAGGKSMGGRMTSLAAAREPLTGVRGLAFFGFPLHAAGKPSADRTRHLPEVGIPMLFLQGTRDSLADLKLLIPICGSLAGRGELFVVDGGDHSFHLLKSAGRSDDQALREIAGKVAAWMAQVSK